MPELFNFRFPEGWYFLNWDNTELKKSSKIIYFCLQPASLGGSGLSLPKQIYAVLSRVILVIIWNNELER